MLCQVGFFQPGVLDSPTWNCAALRPSSFEAFQLTLRVSYPHGAGGGEWSGGMEHEWFWKRLPTKSIPQPAASWPNKERHLTN